MKPYFKGKTASTSPMYSTVVSYTLGELPIPAYIVKHSALWWEKCLILWHHNYSKGQLYYDFLRCKGCTLSVVYSGFTRAFPLEYHITWTL